VKKILIFVTLISYSIASLGVSLNYFYCCGKLKSVSVKVNTEEKAEKGKSSKGCCDNKTVIVKLKVDQKESDKLDYQFAAPLSPVILYADNYILSSPATNCKVNPLYKRPPPLNLPSINILFCVFRI
jgi:hypothetical protein